MSTETELNNPFPGLRPFQTEEDYLFFGRDDQIADLLRRLDRNRLVAVVGTSGSGKSSLVRAGLLPALLGGSMTQAGSAWEVAVMRPGGNPMQHLAQSLCDAGLYDEGVEDMLFHLRATLSRSRRGLMEALRQSHLGPKTNLLLVVDQFEEIFRFNKSNTAQQDESIDFVNLLLEAASQSELPIYVVLTMRSDFLGECSAFLGLAEAVNNGEFLIPRLSRDQMQEAIQGPVRVSGGEISGRLLQRLLNDVGDDQDQLPVLQHALMRTWALWAGDHQETEPLDLRHYDKTGGMQQALSHHADEVFDQLPSDRHRALAEKLFKALTERGEDNRGVRRPSQFQKLCATAGAGAEELGTVIEAFRKPGVTFLMPPAAVKLDPETVVDISHESLMRVWRQLDVWAEEEAQSARIYRRLADTAKLHAENKAGLYHDPDLQIALSWRDDSEPNEVWAEQYGGGFTESMVFLDKSRELAGHEEKEREAARQRELTRARELAEAQRLRAEEQERSARRFRMGMIVGAAVAALAVIASLIALDATRKAQKNEQLAQDAEAELQEELYVADMHRAGKAYDDNSFQQLDELLLKHYPRDGGLDLRGPEWHFWRYAAFTEKASLRSEIGPVPSLAVSPDQTLVAAGTWAGLVNIYRAIDHKLLKALPVNTLAETSEGDVRFALSFSPDGQILAVVGFDQFIRRWNVRTWERVEPDLEFPEVAGSTTSTAILQMCYSPDGSLLAASSHGGFVALWDMANLRVLGTWAASKKQGPFGDLDFSPDGRILTASNGSRKPSTPTWRGFWNVATRDENTTFRDLNSEIFLEFSPDGNWIISGRLDGSIKIRDISNSDFSKDPGQILHTDSRGIAALAVSRSGRYVAASNQANEIRVWELETRNLIATFKGHDRPVWALGFANDDQFLWSSGWDDRIKVWEIGRSGLYSEVPGSSAGLGWSYLDGGRIAWRDMQGDDLNWRVYDADFKEEDSPATQIRLYDVTHGTNLPAWKNGAKYTLHAASGNGKYLATLSPEHHLELWDVSTESLLGETDIPRENFPVFGLDVSPDGRHVAWAEKQSDKEAFELMLSDLAQGKTVSLGEFNSGMDLSFSHNGLMLAGNSYGPFRNVCRVWNLVKSEPVLISTTPFRWAILSSAFSPNGNILALGFWDNRIRFINPQTGVSLRAPMEGHAGVISSLAFLPSGDTLLSGGGDATIRFWDARSGDMRTTLPAQNDRVRAILADPEGQWIASALYRQNTRIWRFSEASKNLPDEDFMSSRLDRLARHGRFEEALKAAFDQMEVFPNSLTARWSAPMLMLKTGDLDGYRRNRSEMLSRAESPDPMSNTFLALASLILPPNPDQINATMRLADSAIAMEGGRFNIPQGHAARHLAEYRGGRYQSAIQMAEAYLLGLGNSASPDAVWFNRAVIALSRYQLNQPDAARKELGEARESFNAFAAQYPGTDTQPSDENWTAWIAAEQILHEAEALIGKGK